MVRAARRSRTGRRIHLRHRVDEALRGRGYGRVALEPIALELGYDEIGLHVFGDNDVARNLYRSSGYVEIDVTMHKRLG